MVLVILISLVAALIQLSTPLAVNFVALVVSRYLAARQLKWSLAAALSGGLLLEVFSPWRFGLLLLLLLLGVAVVRFVMTQFVTLTGFASELAHVGLLVIIISIPAIIITRNVGGFGSELLMTLLLASVVYGFSYVRSRLVRGRV